MNEREDWPGNGWTKYQLMVLRQLEQHSDGIEALRRQNDEILDRINTKIAALNIDIATMKAEQRVRSTVFGFVGALIPVLFDFYINLKK